MAVILLFTKGSREVRDLERLADELHRERVESELVDADSPRGIGITTTYDILSRPAVLLTSIDGQLVQVWTDRIPRTAEIVHLTRI